MSKDLLTRRRENLGKAIQNNELVIVLASEEPIGISLFLQNNNFLYFTGLEETPEAIFLYQKKNDQTTETLFLQRNNPDKIVWDGAKMYPEEAKEISGINDIQYIDELEDYLEHTLATTQKVFINSGIKHLAKPLNKALSLVSQMRERYLHLIFSDLHFLMIPLRQIKDETEIQNIRKAIEYTGLGLNHIFLNALSGMYEYELEAMLFYEMRRKGIAQYGFAPIIASGINATTLHYKKNNCQIPDQSLVLCDVGALYHNYCADITRTFPIAHKFTTRQKEVYSAVLDVQKFIINLIKPGISLTYLNEKAREHIGEACVQLGLLKNPLDYKKYYMHSIGHHLGMDTHDIASRDSILQEGMVITVEPGIYIPEEKIGVRIEDDIYVTKDANLILSHSIPKEIEELEALRSKVN